MKNLKFREIKNNENFDPNSIYENVSFTQANFYGNWQESLGRKTRRFLVYENEEIITYFQLIKYPLLLGKSYLYIPYGPVIKNLSDNFFLELKKELKRIAKTENAAFVRLDFTPPISGEILSKYFTKASFHTYHSAYFQPRTEWFLDLNKLENELLMTMHEKARYSIRLAEKKGITTEIITKDLEKYFDIFYELMTETAKRNGFGLHRQNYYATIFQNLPTGSFLSIAKYGQKILAINLIIVFGKTANYVFGGSSNKERNRTPTYLAQWKAICYAKQLDCAHYNFGGISTESQTYKGWEGLTIFKKKFGGREVKHSDFFDVIESPFWYFLYNFRKQIKGIGL